jgi:hypothetical protein
MQPHPHSRNAQQDRTHAPLRAQRQPTPTRGVWRLAADSRAVPGHVDLRSRLGPRESYLRPEICFIGIYTFTAVNIIFLGPKNSSRGSQSRGVYIDGAKDLQVGAEGGDDDHGDHEHGRRCALRAWPRAAG